MQEKVKLQLFGPESSNMTFNVLGYKINLLRK